jgi:hypothetical protein
LKTEVLQLPPRIKINRRKINKPAKGQVCHFIAS